MNRFSLFLLTLVLAVASPAKSRHFLHWGLEEGLTNSQVVDIVLDKHGNVWIATEAGLNLFDGRSFKLYDITNSSIAGNSLNTLFYDRDDDHLWIGTRSGISIMDCATKRLLPSTPFDKEEMINNIVAFSKSADGMWVANRFGKIVHYNAKTKAVDAYSEETVDGLPRSFQTLYDNKEGLLYIGHLDEGMSVLNPRTRELKRFMNDPRDPASLPGNWVTSITEDNLGNIWVGTHQGLGLFNPVTETFRVFRHVQGDDASLLSDYISMLRVFNGNELWIATDIGGVSVLDLRMLSQISTHPLTFVNIQATYNEYGLSSKSIRSLFQDRFGNVWIGNHGTGIDLLSNTESMFHTLPYLERGMIHKAIHGLYVDQQDRVWVGNENEVALFQGDELVRTYDFSPYLARPSARLSSMLDAGDHLMIGLLDDNGFIRFEPRTGRFTRITLPGNKDIYTLYKTLDGQTLVGSHGLFRYERGELVEATDYDSVLGKMPIYSILQDKEGNLWMGTYGSGIYVFDPSARLIDHLSLDSGFCSNVIHQLYADRDGGIWVATRHGLAYFRDSADRRTVVNYTHKNGLADIYVHAVCQDDAGNLWFSTNSGISMLDVATGTFRHYDYFDGIPRGSFVDKSVARDSKGNLYFGSQNGLCYFDPALSSLNENSSQVHIIECANIYNEGHNYVEETVTPDDHGIISLPYNRNSLAVSFSVHNLALSDKVEYAYMMQGLDKSWILVKNETGVTFRNIPPGNYTFKVRTRMHKQPWSDDNIASQEIVVRPPFWMTWYAITLYVLLAGGVIFLWIRNYKHRLLRSNREKLEKEKVRAEQERNNERLRFYTNVTHELRTPLTLILGPLEDMTKDPNLPQPYDRKIRIIKESAVKLLDLINQLLEFRKTETQNKKLAVSKQDIVRTVREMGLRYKELNRNPNLFFNIHVPAESIPVYFDKEVVDTILTNLLSNAIKYTPSGSITIGLKRVEEDANHIELFVSDTGYGIDEKELPHIFDRYYQVNGSHQASGTGIGLALVKSLAELHEGTLAVQSKLGIGTVFSFRLRLDNTYPNALHKEQPTPQEEVAADEPEPPVAEPSDTKPLILVVEDNDDIRDYTADALSDEYNVITAVNGKEGVDKAMAQIPDVIVSDIMMPVMDGIDVCRILKANVATSHIPIILLTAKTSITDKEVGYESGADSYLTKPFSATLLKNRIKNILDNRAILYKFIKSQLLVNTAVAETDAVAADEKDTGLMLNELDNAFLQKLIAVIEENITSDKLDIGFLQQHLNMSHSTLYRKVKGLTGMTASEFIQKTKLRYAASLLAKGGMNSTEVAYASGFNGVSYFANRFKKEYGVLPSQYSNRNKQ